MEELRKYIEFLYPLSETDWNYFSSRLEACSFTKKQEILTQGKSEQYLYFMLKGIVRYYVPQPFHEVTFGFSFHHQFVTGYDSFLTGLPSAYSIQTLTPASFLRISKEQLQSVYDNTQGGTVIGRMMAEQQYLIKSNREMAFLTKSPEERYLALFTERPELIKHIPLKYLASYIGVTPQALSRIRKRIS